MKTGERVRLLRNLAGLTQTELAEMLGASQRAVTLIEKARATQNVKLNKIAQLFGCSRRWLVFGVPPAFDDCWGYAELPPVRTTGRSATLDTRKVNQINDALNMYFPLFLKEHRSTEVYIVREKEDFCKLFVFPLRLPIIFILKATEMFSTTIDNVIENSQLKILKEITTDFKFINSINAMDAQNTDIKAAQKLFELLGIEVPDEWLLASRYTNDKKVDFQGLLRKRKIELVCKTIEEYGIFPSEVVAGLKDHCSHGNDLDCLTMWEMYFQMQK